MFFWVEEIFSIGYYGLFTGTSIMTCLLHITFIDVLQSANGIALLADLSNVIKNSSDKFQVRNPKI